ncbi:fungal specific transcription factor domain-containing protein [Apiospora hydei]|uniref:Fungal specific transcription factor domain-containing protein n=1 Tax=Apiospora hydei TaxID=1337664 RepID=A0ABR1WP28_9PEZI
MPWDWLVVGSPGGGKENARGACFLSVAAFPGKIGDPCRNLLPATQFWRARAEETVQPPEMGRDPPTKASSSSSYSSSSRRQHRLPVNQRRNKVAPENRKRVSTACNSCNVRRIKCTGEHPCQPCRSSSRQCQYPETVEKISVPRSDWDELVAKCARLERFLEQAVPDETQRRQLLGCVSASASTSPWETSAAQLSYHGDDTASPGGGRASECPLSSSSEELCGPADDDCSAQYYLGPTSANAFLGHVKEVMADVFTSGWSVDCLPPDTMTLLDSVGRFRTHNPRRPPRSPLHETRPMMGVLRKDELNTMVTELRQFIQGDAHVGGSSRGGGIFHWGNLNPSMLELDSLDALPDDGTQKPRRLAFIYASLAVACSLQTPLPCAKMGNVYYGSDACTWLDLPLLVMVSVYLAEANQTDAAYMYASLGMHIAIMQGVHQGCVHDEYEKSAFWTLYVLDRRLCALTGRPPTLMDESIHLPLPGVSRGFPKLEGLVARVKLAKIAGHIVRKTCNQAASSASGAGHDGGKLTDSSYVDATLRMLQKWSATLPVELRLVSIHHMGSPPTAQLVNSGWSTTMPTFLDVVRRAVMAHVDHRRSWHSGQSNSAHYSYAWQCLDAARENLRLAKMASNHLMSPSLPSPSQKQLRAPFLHNNHVFDAAAVVLLHGLIAEPADTGDDMSDVVFAIGCFDARSASSSSSSSSRSSKFPNDCARVLRDLRMLVQRILHRGLGGGAMTAAAAAAAAQIDSHPQKKRTISSVVSSQAPPPSTAIYDVGFILNPEIPPEPPAPAPAHSSGAATASSHALFTELSSWISNDEQQVYNGYSTF